MNVNFWALALVVFIGACSSGKSGTADTTHGASPDSAEARPFTLSDAQLARISVITATSTTFYPVIATTGTVAFDGDKSTPVLAPISGPVTKLLVDVGSTVREGEPLATLTSPDFAAAVATYRKADVTARNLERIAEQDQQMFKADAIARRDMEQAQADAASAVADRDAAIEAMRSLGMDEASIQAIQQNRGGAQPQAVIRAPISGVVVQRLVSPGTLIEAGGAGVQGTPLFTIADLSTMWVWANVFEADLAMVAADESASIATAAWPHPLPARVTYVSATVDSSTRATAVRLQAENPAQVLKSGMFVDVTITSNRSRTGILVPVGAVLRDLENLPYVFVQAPNKSFLRRRVTLGYRVRDQYEITSGLNAGDRVVSNGALFISFAQSQ